MNDPYRPINISDVLEEDISSCESDLPGDEIPDNVSLGDSTESEDEYRPPDVGELSSSDNESSDSDSNVPLAYRLARSNWVQVIPPEPEINIENRFTARNVGIKNCPPRNSRPIEYFNLFFTDFIWDMIVRETNLYANTTITNKRESGELKQFSRLQRWVDVSHSDIKKYVALVLNMGLIRMKNVVDYWSKKKNRYISFFPNTMSINRFQAINAMIHVSSKQAVPRNHADYDPWYKIRAFYDYINAKLKEHFIPSQNLSIDESLIGMKNRCVFIQYMPKKKHARFGIKKFELCDSESSYVVNVALYSGRDFLSEGTDPFTQKVVMDQLTKSNLLHKGYHVFTDNFYTKLPLAATLLRAKTFITGTVNRNTKGLCKNVVQAKLGVQESIYYKKDKVLLVGYKQKATRKPVFLISTGCHAEDKMVTSKKGTRAIKPVVIDTYNLKMGGVDNSDKSTYHLSCSRTSKKYWKKIFFNLIDIAVFDAFILYSRNTDRPMDRDEFVDSIVLDLADEDPTENQVPGQNDGHTLQHLPGRKERNCAVCSSNHDVKRKRSNFWCPSCNCGIHPMCYPKLKHFYRPMAKGRKKRTPESDSD